MTLGEEYHAVTPQFSSHTFGIPLIGNALGRPSASDNSELVTPPATVYSHRGKNDKAELEAKAASRLAKSSTRALEDASQLKTPRQEGTPNKSPR